jgi:hypothetical protein
VLHLEGGGGGGGGVRVFLGIYYLLFEI